MKKLTIMLAMLVASVASYAEPGDTIPMKAEQIIEIKKEVSTTKSGKEKTEILVIYKDNNGKKKLAYMTSTDHKKLIQAQQYGLDIDYMLVELKTRTKLIIK